MLELQPLFVSLSATLSFITVVMWLIFITWLYFITLFLQTNNKHNSIIIVVVVVVINIIIITRFSFIGCMFVYISVCCVLFSVWSVNKDYERLRILWSIVTSCCTATISPEAIYLLSGWNSLKLATNIYHVSGHYWKGFQGQRSKTNIIARLNAHVRRRHIDRRFAVKDHLVLSYSV